jgi:hypothetical protein
MLYCSRGCWLRVAGFRRRAGAGAASSGRSGHAPGRACQGTSGRRLLCRPDPASARKPRLCPAPAAGKMRRRAAPTTRPAAPRPRSRPPRPPRRRRRRRRRQRTRSPRPRCGTWNTMQTMWYEPGRSAQCRVPGSGTPPSSTPLVSWPKPGVGLLLDQWEGFFFGGGALAPGNMQQPFAWAKKAWAQQSRPYVASMPMFFLASHPPSVRLCRARGRPGQERVRGLP